MKYHHTHGTAVTETAMGAPSGNASMAVAYQKTDGFSTGATGGGQKHNNIQPSIVLNYIIKVSTTTSIQGEIVDSLDGNSATNAPSIRAVNESIENIKGTILWTNPNPEDSSGFSAQTIALSSSDYDILEIFYTQYYTESQSILLSQRCPKNYGSVLISSLNAGVSRRICTSNGSTVTFQDTSVAGSNLNNIPVYVVGYKTGLFS